MNNYLKKLAYIKRELVKLAAPVTDEFGYLPNPNVHPLDNVRGTNYKKPSPMDAIRNGTPAPVTNSSNSGVSPSSVLSGPVPEAAYSYSPEQLQNIRNYQNALVAGIMARDGYTTEEDRNKVIDDLRAKNRWYDIEGDNVVNAQSLPKGSLKRFNDIMNGKRGVDQIKWRGGTVGATPNMSNPTPGSPNARKRPTPGIAQGIIGDSNGFKVTPSMPVLNPPKVPMH